METDNTLLPLNFSAKLATIGTEMRVNMAGMIALEVKLLAGRLFIYREQKTTWKLRRQARGIYHDFERIRRRLAEDRTLDGQDALDPARDCIADLLDLARETMDAKNQP